MPQRIAVTAVLLVGLAIAFVLLRAGASKMVVDAPLPPHALYLLWAAFATVWITLAAAWFVSTLCTRPRRSTPVRSSAVLVVCALGFLCVGEVAAYVAKHPNSQSSRWYAIAVFIAGVGAIAVAGRWAERLLVRPAAA